ncbi:hypothetical protein Sjap_005790 [Stephania japonica]|uniref:HMA domain-containing protein n=1 Tax=Stephania japonica TaxID=461633 RepID=A0AAP0K4S5_9MAGN
MATALRRALGFFFSSFEFLYFRYLSEQNSSRRRNNKSKMPRGRHLALQTVELQVRMCCTGCERVVRNAILKLRGT